MNSFSTYTGKLLLLFCLLICPLISLAQEKNQEKNFKVTYSEEENKTTVLLAGMELPDNKDSFRIGAYFEYKGNKLETPPCCVVLFLTSISKKHFQYKENHNLQIQADKSNLNFGKINWQESAEGTAFILAGMAYPEEMFIGMEREKFLKIAGAKKVSVQIGSFKFTMTDGQLSRFRELAARMNQIDRL